MNEKKKHLHDFQMRKFHMIPEIYVNISGIHMIM